MVSVVTSSTHRTFLGMGNGSHVGIGLVTLWTPHKCYQYPFSNVLIDIEGGLYWQGNVLDYLLFWIILKICWDFSTWSSFTLHLLIVYIVDHEFVPRPCKICDWLLNSSRDHSGLHQGWNVRVIMEFEVPKRHILRPTLSTNKVKWVLWWDKQKRCFSRKRQGPMAN